MDRIDAVRRRCLAAVRSRSHLSVSSGSTSSLSAASQPCLSSVEERTQGAAVPQAMVPEHHEGPLLKKRRLAEEAASICAEYLLPEKLSQLSEDMTLISGAEADPATGRGTVLINWPEGTSPVTRGVCIRQGVPYSWSRERRQLFQMLWFPAPQRREGLGWYNPDSYNVILVGDEAARGTTLPGFVPEGGALSSIAEERDDEGSDTGVRAPADSAMEEAKLPESGAEAIIVTVETPVEGVEETVAGADAPVTEVTAPSAGAVVPPVAAEVAAESSSSFTFDLEDEGDAAQEVVITDVGVTSPAQGEPQDETVVPASWSGQEILSDKDVESLMFSMKTLAEAGDPSDDVVFTQVAPAEKDTHEAEQGPLASLKEKEPAQEEPQDAGRVLSQVSAKGKEPAQTEPQGAERDPAMSGAGNATTSTAVASVTSDMVQSLVDRELRKYLTNQWSVAAFGRRLRDTMHNAYVDHRALPAASRRITALEAEVAQLTEALKVQNKAMAEMKAEVDKARKSFCIHDDAITALQENSATKELATATAKDLESHKSFCLLALKQVEGHIDAIRQLRERDNDAKSNIPRSLLAEARLEGFQNCALYLAKRGSLPRYLMEQRSFTDLLSDKAQVRWAMIDSDNRSRRGANEGRYLEQEVGRADQRDRFSPGPAGAEERQTAAGRATPESRRGATHEGAGTSDARRLGGSAKK